MKKQKALFIVVAALVVLLTGAVFLYENLADENASSSLRVQSGDGTPIIADRPDRPAESETAPPEGAPASDSSDEQRVKAPDFTVYDGEGNAVRLSDMAGKPVVLNFWASWCGPCKSEMPDFDAAFAEYGGEVHFMMVNMTDGASETKQSAQKYLDEGGYSFPVYFDTDIDAAVVYGVMAIPTTYFIDAEGYAVAQGSGALSADIIQTGIDMILP